MVVLKASVSVVDRDCCTVPSVHFRFAVLDTLLVGEEGEIVLAGRASTVTPRSASPGLFGGGSLGLHGDGGQWRVASVTSGSRRSNERASICCLFSRRISSKQVLPVGEGSGSVGWRLQALAVKAPSTNQSPCRVPHQLFRG